MFLEYLTEYFKKKAVHAHWTVFYNVTLLGIKVDYVFLSGQNRNTFPYRKHIKKPKS